MQRGFTPMFISAQNGFTAVVDRLIAAKGNVNQLEKVSGAGFTGCWLCEKYALDVRRTLLCSSLLEDAWYARARRGRCVR